MVLTPEEPNTSYWWTGQSLKTVRPRIPTCALPGLTTRKRKDSISHAWILECLELYKTIRTLRALIKNCMRFWITSLEANSRQIAQVNIKCSIYQGDALSPLLFSIGLNKVNFYLTGKNTLGSDRRMAIMKRKIVTAKYLRRVS